MKLYSERLWFHKICLAIFLLMVIPGPVQAGGITVQKSKALPDFPNLITFLVTIQAPSKIDQVSLHYGLTSQSCYLTEATEPIKFEPANQLNLNWVWNLEQSGYLLPGSEIWWEWEIHTETGETLKTDRQYLTLMDPKFNWQSLEEGPITLYWTRGGKNFGQTLLTLASESLQRLSNEAGVEAPEKIHIVIYPSEKEMQKALEGIAKWAGGAAFPEYNLVLTGIDPNDRSNWATTVIPHEIAHLIIKIQVDNCHFTEPPLWLNEGLAQYAEGRIPSSQRSYVLHALKNYELPDLKTLEEQFPEESSEANLAYGQSRMVVTFMIETFGKEKLDELLGLIKKGSPNEEALRRVYGLDTNGLDQAWRASQGIGEAPTPDFSTPTVMVTNTMLPTMELHPSVWSSPTATAMPIPPTLTPSPTPKAVAIATETPVPQLTTVAPARIDRKNMLLVLICTGGLIGLLVAGILVVGGLLLYWRGKKST